MYKPENIRTIENHDLVKLAVVIDQTELFPSEMLGEMIEPSFSDPESSDIWITYIHEDMPIAFAFCEHMEYSGNRRSAIVSGQRCRQSFDSLY